MSELVPIFEADIDIKVPTDLPYFGDFHSPLTEDQARSLTDTICNAMDVVWMLIARAHAGKAWDALGYETWSDYVKEEFDMSRSRSYQLLDQARVVGAIEAALPEGTSVSITEAAARDLKGILEEVVPEIRERTEGLDPEEASDVLAEIVEEQRERLKESRQEYEDEEDFDDYDGGYEGNGKGKGKGNYHGEDPDPIYDDVDDLDVTAIRQAVNAAHDLYASLPALASLPEELDDIIKIIPRERRSQIDENLYKAQEKLGKFAEAWEAAKLSEEDDQ